MSSHSNTLLKSLRHWLGVGVVFTVLWAIGISVCAQDLKPEQRLEAIRAALVEAAMKSNTRVSTTSWMDTRGALLELNRFSSEIRLRDIQIGQYKKTNNVETVELSNRTLESVAAVSCTAPRARSPIRHVMRVSEVVLWQGRRGRVTLAACSVQRGRSHAISAQANTRARVQ